ncbi:MAG: winged helix-turn-helix transcriptional regulator [Nanobdellota archaeon]
MLDKTDKTILEHLIANCRISTSRLARLTGLKQPTVHYRIKRLEDQGYILKYDCLIDLDKFSLPFAFVFCKVPPKKKAGFETHLQDQGFMTAFRMGHHYNYLINSFFTRTQKEQFQSYLEEHQIPYRWEESTENYPLIPTIFDMHVKKPLAHKSSVKKSLDHTDMHLIEHLFNGGARNSMLTIARKLDASADLIHYRFKRLKQAGYFPYFTAQANPEKLHLHYDMIRFTLKDMTSAHCIRRFQQMTSFVYLAHLGNNTYICTAVSQGLQNLIEIIARIQDTFDDQLTEIEPCLIESILHLNQLDLSAIL